MNLVFILVLLFTLAGCGGGGGGKSDTTNPILMRPGDRVQFQKHRSRWYKPPKRDRPGIRPDLVP